MNASLDDGPRYWTPEQVATRLQLTVHTVQDFAKRGILPAVRFGKHWRFPIADMERAGQVSSRSKEVNAK